MIYHWTLEILSNPKKKTLGSSPEKKSRLQAFPRTFSCASEANTLPTFADVNGYTDHTMTNRPTAKFPELAFEM